MSYETLCFSLRARAGIGQSVTQGQLLLLSPSSVFDLCMNLVRVTDPDPYPSHTGVAITGSVTTSK